MTRQESQILKGFAILSMIFLHLFMDGRWDPASCHPLLYIGQIPFATILTRACTPVPMFLILGGYGLYKVWVKGDKNRWGRLIKLYIHWWIIMTIFLFIGHFIKPMTYPGTLKDIILNAIGYFYTYNAELWFLFPYVIVSACAPYIFRLMSFFKPWVIIIVTLLINITISFCVSRYGFSYLYSHLYVYNFILPFGFLFNFCLGALAAREKWFERAKNTTDKPLKTNTLYLGGVIFLIIINCIFKYNFFYPFLLIWCLSMIKLPVWTNKGLKLLGDNSMNMWMIHSWFCYYLFHNFIYSFKYPIIIFIVLIFISYLCSLIINIIAKPIERLFITRRQIEEKPIL